MAKSTICSPTARDVCWLLGIIFARLAMAGHSLGVTGFGPKGLASKAQEEGWGNPTKMNRFQVGELD